jgi:integrase
VFLVELDKYFGNQFTKYALKLLILTTVRAGEVCGAEWSEIDFENKRWTIPAKRMKMKRDHVIPLSRQALAILREMENLSGGRKLVFPGRNNPQNPISTNAFLFALKKRLGYPEATVHGFRSTASTIMNESGLWKVDVIEKQLAHGDPNEIRAAYNRAEYMEERARMLQWWADFLDTQHAIGTGANVTMLNTAKQSG